MRINLANPLIIGFSICLTLIQYQALAQSDGFLVTRSTPASIHLGNIADPLTGAAAQRLANYIEAVTGVAPEIRSDTAETGDESSPCFVFELKAYPYRRPCAFEIVSGTSDSVNTVRLRASKPPGFKYAVQKLILKMEQREKSLFVPELEHSENPWVKGRELFIAEIEWHPTESEKQYMDDLKKQFSWLNWDISRLRRYVDLVDAMGYNTIMLTDSELLQEYAGDFESKTGGIRKIQAMFEHARNRGMGTSFFLWTQKGLGSRPVPNPRDPAQYEEMKANWNLMIDRYGALVDKWVLHWADPGGCKSPGCTVNTPQVASNEFRDLLRRKGFRGQVSFSLWALRWGAWPGYHDWSSVVDSGILHPEIGINLMRNYRYDAASSIARQMRTTGVWGWYLNDLETRPAMHVHSEILENEFRRVHPSASLLLDWYSLEDNDHVLNLPSLYVGGRMLWNNQTSAEEALMEFCQAIWGPEAARKIFQGLRALEKVRCGPGENMVRQNLWPHGYFCHFGRGTNSPSTDLSLCLEALQELDSVILDPGFVQKLPMIVDPAELLYQIRAHLKYVSDFAKIRLAYQDAIQPALYSGELEETQRLMAEIPELPDLIPDSYGALEYTAYKVLRKFAEGWKDRSFHDNLAFGKRVYAPGYYKSDRRFAPQMAVNGLLCEYEEEGWAANTLGPSWLKIDLGGTTSLSRVRIYNRGYHREDWDNNRMATPEKVDVFYALEDADPSTGTLEPNESGYKLLGGFDGWEPTDDPTAFQEIGVNEPVQARYIKVVIFAAANREPPGTGEIEVR
jgi:hypothetical protein